MQREADEKAREEMRQREAAREEKMRREAEEKARAVRIQREAEAKAKGMTWSQGPGHELTDPCWCDNQLGELMEKVTDDFSPVANAADVGFEVSEALSAEGEGCSSRG